jgi:uncharacterized lipoprotein YmbA
MKPATLRRVAVWSVLTVSVLWLSGCARSAPSRFYLLEPVAEPAAAAPAGTCGLRVDPLPDYLCRPMLATRLGPNEVNYLEYHRWAEHLDEALPTILAEDLARVLGQPKVWLYPWDTASRPERIIQVRIVRLDADLDSRVTLRAVTGEKEVWQQHVITVQAPSDDPADLVAAQSQALAELASRIAGTE